MKQNMGHDPRIDPESTAPKMPTRSRADEGREGAGKLARSAVALTAAPRYCCAPTVSRLNLLRQVQRGCSSLIMPLRCFASDYSTSLQGISLTDGQRLAWLHRVQWLS